jgi:hypothetical protein
VRADPKLRLSFRIDMLGISSHANCGPSSPLLCRPLPTTALTIYRQTVPIQLLRDSLAKYGLIDGRSVRLDIVKKFSSGISSMVLAPDLESKCTGASTCVLARQPPSSRLFWTEKSLVPMCIGAQKRVLAPALTSSR